MLIIIAIQSKINSEQKLVSFHVETFFARCQRDTNSAAQIRIHYSKKHFRPASPCIYLVWFLFVKYILKLVPLDLMKTPASKKGALLRQWNSALGFQLVTFLSSIERSAAAPADVGPPLLCPQIQYRQRECLFEKLHAGNENICSLTVFIKFAKLDSCHV